MSAKIIKLSAAEIEKSLTEETRQYLVGDLQRPQKLSHIHSDLIEVGITRYPKSAAELPHYHTQAFEFQFMLAGFTVYLDTRTGEEFTFKKGDFYVIEPGVAYAQKAAAGTAILFFKVPPGNDKVSTQQTDEIREWFATQLKSKRTDYFYDLQAPAPNSMRPAVAVAVINDSQQILMLKRRDNEKWTMPGGTMEYNESLTDCARREVSEETGYQIEVTDLAGTYTDPNILIAYSDGEVRREFTLVYIGKIVTGELKIDDESLTARWFELDDALKLPLADSQRQRLEDLTKFFNDKSIKMR